MPSTELALRGTRQGPWGTSDGCEQSVTCSDVRLRTAGEASTSNHSEAQGADSFLPKRQQQHDGTRKHIRRTLGRKQGMMVPETRCPSQRPGRAPRLHSKGTQVEPRAPVVGETELESREAKAGRVHRSEVREERAAQREDPGRAVPEHSAEHGASSIGK